MSETTSASGYTCRGVPPCPVCNSAGCTMRNPITNLPTPDPASGMVMDPVFVRLVNRLVDAAQAWQERNDEDGDETYYAIEALHRWHRKQVERAATKAIMAERAMHTRLADTYEGDHNG